MANDKVEFDILINGKPAKKSLEEVKKELKDVEKQDESTTKVINTNWATIGATIALAAVGVASMINSAARLDRAMFGLNQQTRDYIRNMSVTSGLTKEVIAGFVQTGKTAGMSGDAIEKMIDSAVALGRAYPHESAETFIDNLTMLNTTGEAQGFIVDVLEQKYGTLDLKAISLADKMKTIDEATKGVNEAFEETAGAKFDQILSEASASSTDLGNSLLRLVDKSGIMWLFTKAIDTVAFSTQGWANLLDYARIKLKELIGEDVTKDIEEYNKNLDKMDALLLKITGDAEAATGEISIFKSPEDVKNDLDTFRELIKSMMAKLRSDFKNNEITPEQLLFAEDQVNDWADKVQAGIARGLSMDEAMKSTAGALDMMAEELTEIEKSGRKAGKGLEDAFVKMAQTGKLSFKDMTDAIIADLIRIAIRKSITAAIGGSTMGGFLGFHTGGEVKHTGGAIGGGSHIPSYHTGMRSDERMAKLQVGESVVNRAGTANNGAAIDAMNRGQKISGGGDTFVTHTHNWSVTTPDAGSFASQMIQNKDVITSVIQKDVMTNGTTRTVLKQAL